MTPKDIEKLKRRIAELEEACKDAAVLLQSVKGQHAVADALLARIEHALAEKGA